MTNTIYVSVNKTFDPEMTLAQVARCATGNWRVTPTKAKTCHRVCAVYQGKAVGAWQLLDAAYSDEVDGQGERRTMLCLGEALPILETDRGDLHLRRGIVTVWKGGDPLN